MVYSWAIPSNVLGNIGDGRGIDELLLPVEKWFKTVGDPRFECSSDHDPNKGLYINIYIRNSRET